MSVTWTSFSGIWIVMWKLVLMPWELSRVAQEGKIQVKRCNDLDFNELGTTNKESLNLGLDFVLGSA